jgi:hypothetical protein
MKKINQYLIVLWRSKLNLLNNLKALILICRNLKHLSIFYFTAFSKGLSRCEFSLQPTTRTSFVQNLRFIQLINLKLNLSTTNQIYNLNKTANEN